MHSHQRIDATSAGDRIATVDGTSSRPVLMLLSRAVADWRRRGPAILSKVFHITFSAGSMVSTSNIRIRWQTRAAHLLPSRPEHS